MAGGTDRSKGALGSGTGDLVLTWAIKLMWLWTSPILSSSLGVGVEERERTLSNSFLKSGITRIFKKPVMGRIRRKN